MHTSLHSYSTLISYSKYKPDILNSSQNTNSKSISSDEFNNSSSESDCNSEIESIEVVGEKRRTGSASSDKDFGGDPKRPKQEHNETEIDNNNLIEISSVDLDTQLDSVEQENACTPGNDLPNPTKLPLFIEHAGSSSRAINIPFAGTLGGITDSRCLMVNSKNEKRLSRYRSSPSKALMERMEVAMTVRMFLLKRYPAQPDIELARKFVVLGPTGSVYTITLANLPSCNCPDSAKGHHCCHILFVFLKVLKVSNTDPILYQRALLTSELRGLYTSAPPDPASLIGTEQNPLGQIPVKGDCPICYDKMNDTDALVWCKDKCGSNMHRDCFETWVTRWLLPGNQVECPVCNSGWSVDNNTPPEDEDKEKRRKANKPKK